MTVTGTQEAHGGDRRALAEAEQRLFDVLGVEYRSERLALAGAPVDHVRVLEVGEGEPILFLHGAGMSASLWAPLLARLTHRRCLAVDLPGCGLTDGFDHRGIDLRDHGRSFLTAVLDALQFDHVPTVANSLGATYGLYLAAADPARSSHLVLLGAPGVALAGGRGSLAMGLYSRPTLGRLLSATSPTITPRLARRLLTGLCGGPAVDALPREMFEVVAATMRISEPTTRSLMPELFSGRVPRPHHALTDDELARIGTPTTFVWGSRDRFQDPTDGHRAATLMPNASVIEVPSGHHPWWDDPRRCAALVDQAIASRHGADGSGAAPDRSHLQD